MHLAGHVADLLAGFRHHSICVVLVELLHCDKGAEGFLQTAFLGRFFDLFRHLGGPLGLKLDEIRVD